VTKEPTVFVVDDDQIVRDSLATLLTTAKIRTEMFSDALEFLDRFDPERAGCLLLDVRMPGMSGLELQRHLSTMEVPMTTIILTGHADVPMAVGAMKTGASDLIEKPFRADDLIRRVRQAMGQNVEARRLWNRKRELQKRIDDLTPREKTVLALIIEGNPTKAIALHLGTSFNTVRNQRTSIMRKMKTESVVDLVRIMTEVGGQAEQN
jgi:FixJ family two-component response regulator